MGLPLTQTFVLISNVGLQGRLHLYLALQELEQEISLPLERVFSVVVEEPVAVAAVAAVVS